MLRPTTLALLALTLGAATAQEEEQNQPMAAPSDCRAFNVFIVRGSNEPYPGRPGPFVARICDELGGEQACGYEDVVYPALLSMSGPGAFCRSAGEGAANGQRQITEYAERCPDASLILVAYSQGASVLEDILGGGGGPVFDCVQPDNPPFKKTERPGSSIVAAVGFGAVRHTADQPFNFGEGSAFNGTSPRSAAQLESLAQYTDVYRDWCNNGDNICAVGSEPEDVEQHWNYFEVHFDEGVKWIVSTARKGRENRGQDQEAEAEASSGNNGTSGPQQDGEESAGLRIGSRSSVLSFGVAALAAYFSLM